MNDVRLLSQPTNYAVVQLPERKFPGVVFQGDSLSILIGELEEVASENDPIEKAEGLSFILERLIDVRSHYENVLKKEGLKLPY